MKISWTDQLSVGNALIDSDHRNLITVLNRMSSAIEDGRRVDLSVAFELLEAYMQIHVQNEERIADAIGYSFAEDSLALAQLMGEMKYMINKLVTTYSEWPEKVVSLYTGYLFEWIDEHINKVNMQMKPALEEVPYEFIPGMSKGNSHFKTSMVLPIGSYVEPNPPI